MSFLVFRNGNTAWFDQVDREHEVGDVILIAGEVGNQRAEKVPSSAWPEELWVGIVKNQVARHHCDRVKREISNGPDDN